MYNFAQCMFYKHVSVDCFLYLGFPGSGPVWRCWCVTISYHENLGLLNNAASSITLHLELLWSHDICSKNLFLRESVHFYE
jgi:hypothetical protein